MSSPKHTTKNTKLDTINSMPPPPTKPSPTTTKPTSKPSPTTTPKPTSKPTPTTTTTAPPRKSTTAKALALARLPRTQAYDPWNSSSTGHQHAENRLSGSTSWRASRTYKLKAQFSDVEGGGGERLYDLVGAGSEGFGRSVEEDEEERGRRGVGVDVRRMLLRGGKRVDVNGGVGSGEGEGEVEGDGDGGGSVSTITTVSKPNQTPPPLPSTQKPPQIFHHCTIYLSGSTLSSGISDHKLKHLLTQHGARIALTLARRSVTHVIVGRPNTPTSTSSSSSSSTNKDGRDKGAGGGLSASKMQKEILHRRPGSAGGVKYVSVEWALESLRVGRRVGEGGYAVLGTAGCGVGRLDGFFKGG